MKLIPQNNTVLCKCINEDKKIVSSGAFTYEKEDLAQYEIIESALSTDDFNVGDVIICNSTGTKVKLADEYQYIFTYDTIVGKIS